MRRHRVVVALFAVLVALACGEAARAGKPPAAAAPKSVAPVATPAQKTAARIHFQRAEQSFKQGDYAGAQVEYEAAHRAWPLDGFLFNIAQCERNRGRIDKAIAGFERYLASPGPVKNRGEVEVLLEELRTQQRGASAPSDATSSSAAAPPADSAPQQAATTPAPALAEATSAGASLAGPPAPPPGPLSDPLVAPSAAAARSPATDEEPTYRKTWFWVVTGAALVVVAGTVALVAAASSSTPAGSLGTADWR